MRRGCPAPPFRLVISMRTHVNSWSVGTSSLRQPQMPCLDLIFFSAPPPRWLPHVLFKNDCMDPAPHSLISCTCTKGRQDREGAARAKREGHAFPPGSLTLLYPLRPRVKVPASTGALQLRGCEDAARLSRIPSGRHGNLAALQHLPINYTCFASISFQWMMHSNGITKKPEIMIL